MGNVAEKTRVQMIVDLLFDALRVNDRTINERAAGVFRQLGPEVVRRLVLEATSKKNSLPHRLRVLAVIERIGHLPGSDDGADDWLALNLLAADKNPKIRDAAARCLVRHSRAGVEAAVGG